MNESQSQSLNLMEINLLKKNFSYIQVYITLSRVTNILNFVLLFKQDTFRKIKNIIYLEALLLNID